ncbi:MAG: hypothetical protein JW803_00215 [Endomicrobiales bacterium]|nr:hypothetical protein [Endomicrobiales bacterium]
MFKIPNFTLYVTDLDLILLVFALINLFLLFVGVGKYAIFSAIDSIVYLFFPKFAVKYDYRRFYPGFIKDDKGKVKKAFSTSRDEHFPGHGPFNERLVDFFLRFPFFSLTFFVLFAPICAKIAGPVFNRLLEVVSSQFPELAVSGWMPSASVLFRVFIILFFVPFASIHSTLASVYTIVLYPLGMTYRGTAWFLKKMLPLAGFFCLFALLYTAEITLIYVGFLPLFHKGLIPFVDGGEGLRQFIFWMPIKFKIFLDLVLVPIVVVVPLITTIGSYILSRHDARKEGHNIDYVVLFYRTGISYLYAPLLSKIFPKLAEEARAVRDERRINEILVLGMYLESIVCVSGMAYAYLNMSKASGVPIGGILMGILVLIVFVPLIVFSSNGFQSYFLDKTVLTWKKVQDEILSIGRKRNA